MYSKECKVLNENKKKVCSFNILQIDTLVINTLTKPLLIARQHIVCVYRSIYIYDKE